MYDIFLGALQGLTEFLPISSSGHLGLAQNLLGLDTDVLARTVLFHFGTMLSCCTFFLKDIIAYLKQRRLVGYITTVTLITLPFGLFFKAFLEPLLSSSAWIGIFLMLNGVLLLTTRWAGPDRRPITLLDSVLMGLAQGFAILPGISRSGITIATLLLRGCKREDAFKFSFIASMPAIIAAFILQGISTNTGHLLRDPSIYAGIAAAYIVGLAALYILKGIILLKRFHHFGFYCLALGALALLVIT